MDAYLCTSWAPAERIDCRSFPSSQRLPVIGSLRRLEATSFKGKNRRDEGRERSAAPLPLRPRDGTSLGTLDALEDGFATQKQGQGVEMPESRCCVEVTQEAERMASTDPARNE